MTQQFAVNFNPVVIQSLDIGPDLTAGHPTQFRATVANGDNSSWHWQILGSNGEEFSTNSPTGFEHLIGSGLGDSFRVRLEVTGPSGNNADFDSREFGFQLTTSGSTVDNLVLSDSSPVYWSGVFNEFSQQTDSELIVSRDSYTGVRIGARLHAVTHSRSRALLAGFHGCTTVTLNGSGITTTMATGVDANTSRDIPFGTDVSLEGVDATGSISAVSDYRTC